jgi:phosphatidylserine/phosphatidylglycerophosphate/cardiolipin synthase-like enzyme
MAAPEPGGPGSISLKSQRPRRRWRRGLLLLPAIWLALAVWHVHKPLPPGVHVAGEFVATPAASLRFLADVTAMDGSGQRVRRQSIHAATLELVRGARDFLLLDYFLFNGQGGPAGSLDYGEDLAPVSRELIAAVRELKQAQPALPVLVLVDPINDYYRGSALPELAALEALGAEVVVTRLDGLRDSNPLYSATWRMLFAWWLPVAGDGSISNFLDGAGPELKLGALLRLPNFKANHRKVVLTGDGAGSLVGIVSSANPHDASSAHSNVALRIEGEALRPLLRSELGVAAFSGWRGEALGSFLRDARPATVASDAQSSIARDLSIAQPPVDDTRAAIVTEGAIRSALVERFATTQPGDAIDIAQFYLAERSVIEALLAAARRGVAIRVLLDANRDAFGFEKSGVPNRPVGHELVEKSEGTIALRWYRTHGEQFHAKLASVRADGRLWLMLGSANLTRRNIGDYNLEANAVVDTPLGSPLAAEVDNWFETLWSNAGDVTYSDPAERWLDASRLRYWQYRLMEATGLSTF